jgi:small subunit ribosomal protein S1
MSLAVTVAHPSVRRLSPPAEFIEAEVKRLMGTIALDPDSESSVESLKIASLPQPDTIVTGRIVRVEKDRVVVDVGAKAEGRVPLEDFEDGEIPAVGTEIEVYVEQPDEGVQELWLSKRKADRKRKWNELIERCKEGDVVTGKVLRKIKGGLLIDIGVPAFLPASQVSLRRTKDIGEYLGQELECEIIKIDTLRENIVVSRRKMQEMQRERLKQLVLADIQEGEVREGVVKNIADFGAFVDLGGIDGLLHITDMSWGRVQHPSEMLQNNQEIKVKILKVDRDRERIALGLKQLTPSPWEGITARYAVSTRHKGKVVNIMSYGAFIKLEEGIEGLVHISEMSWTRRINDPKEIVNLGDEIEVQVLGVNEEKQEISLGMKQLEENPWDRVVANYQPGRKVKGTVRNLTNYGAFVEIEPGIDGLLHVTDISWTKKVSHPNELLKKGDELECVVLNIDLEKHRIALGRKQLSEDPWDRDIPSRFGVGALASGTVTKVTNFGAFVELEEGLEGLLHISELPDRGHVGFPKPGTEVKVRVIRLEKEDRKIGLTIVEDE